MDSIQLYNQISIDEDSSNGGFDFTDIEDDELLQATCMALESGKLTPIIKQELKCVIQSRRLANGKDELNINFKPKTYKSRQLSDGEKIKLERRREQNRLAAQRFRKNIKDKRSKIHQERDRLMNLNQKLRLTVEILEKERKSMLLRLYQLLSKVPSDDVAAPSTVSLDKFYDDAD